jgi:Domain of unknown function (DUF4342)
MNEVTPRQGGWLVANVRKLVAAGNGRSLILKRDGKIVVEVPLATSVLGLVPAVVLVPELTAVAAIVALAAKCSIELG